MGEEAKKLFNDAQVMLKQIVKDKTLRLTGIVGIYPAARVGEDVEVYADDSRQASWKQMGSCPGGIPSYWCLAHDHI